MVIISSAEGFEIVTARRAFGGFKSHVEKNALGLVNLGKMWEWKFSEILGGLWLYTATFQTYFEAEIIFAQKSF